MNFVTRRNVLKAIAAALSTFDFWRRLFGPPPEVAANVKGVGSLWTHNPAHPLVDELAAIVRGKERPEGVPHDFTATHIVLPPLLYDAVLDEARRIFSPRSIDEIVRINKPLRCHGAEIHADIHVDQSTLKVYGTANHGESFLCYGVPLPDVLRAAFFHRPTAEDVERWASLARQLEADLPRTLG